MEYRIDHDGCISCGYCVDLCPEVFRMADDGQAEEYAQPTNAEVEAKAAECVDGCPVGVIFAE